MYSVFSPFFRRSAGSTLPAFLLICLSPWGCATAAPVPPAPAQTQAPVQPAARAPVPAGMQRIYVFDSMDSSMTPMLCRPENPAVPAAKEGRLGVKTGTGNSLPATTVPARNAAPVPAIASPRSTAPAPQAPLPAQNAGMGSSPAFSPAPGQVVPSPYSPASGIPPYGGGKIVPTPLEQEIQTIWKYYARRDQAYLPRGEGPLWGPSPDPAARKQVPEFSRTYIRASAPAASRPAPKTTPASQSQATPATAPQGVRNPCPDETTPGMQGSPAGLAPTVPRSAQSAEPLAPSASAPRAPSALAPAAGSGSLPASALNTTPQMPAPTVPASRSLGM